MRWESNIDTLDYIDLITKFDNLCYILPQLLTQEQIKQYPSDSQIMKTMRLSTFITDEDRTAYSNRYTTQENPNSILEQSGTIKIPVNPKVDPAHTATPLGPIGIALNGVLFFNQYAGPSQPLTNEIVSFDKYYGHPQQSGMYHYHVEPLYLTTTKTTKSGLLGFLLDGFPVYGPQEEDGTLVTNSMLDVYHGHTHKTMDYSSGIYHYHFTAEAPYLNGNGFYGTPGTISQ